MTAAPSVLVFDVNETLIDIDAMAPLFEQIFGDARAMREWFGQLVMYSMTTALSGCYVDFFTLGQGMLRMLGDIHGMRITDADLERIKQAMLTMPAHPDVADGLSHVARQRLSARHADELTAQPRTAPARWRMPDSAGTSSASSASTHCRTYKPARDVYDYVCRELRLRRRTA